MKKFNEVKRFECNYLEDGKKYFNVFEMNWDICKEEEGCEVRNSIVKLSVKEEDIMDVDWWCSEYRERGKVLGWSEIDLKEFYGDIVEMLKEDRYVRICDEGYLLIVENENNFGCLF